MATGSSPPVPEFEWRQGSTARRLQEAFTSADAQRASSRMGRLVHSPIRMALATAATRVESSFRWSVPARTKTFWGARMRIRLPEPISNQLLGCRLFEPGLTTFMLRILNPGDTVIDVGAHYGYFALLAAELVGMDGQVHAFEPTPSTFNVLERNTRDRRNVIANNTAVWSQRADITVTDLGPRLSAFNSVFTPRLGEHELRRSSARRLSVPAVSLDEYCSEHTLRPAFVKVDAESSEHQILQGMTWALNEPRPFVTLEVGDFDLPDVPKSSQLVRTLMSNAYVAFEHDGGGMRIHRPRDAYGYDNLLFGPSEHPVVELMRRHGVGREAR
jgi:FkbM family methyltransferase